MDAREHVDERHADLDRRTVGLAGDALQPDEALHHRIVARELGVAAVLAEARDRAHDQRRVHPVQSRRIEPVARERPGQVVLDHDVGRGGRAQDRAAMGGVAEVERGRALVAVRGQVVGARPAHERRAPGARLVAEAGPLDLPHVGAQVAEQHGRVGSREHAREVEDAKAGEWGRYIDLGIPSGFALGVRSRSW
jgi:hypothetical protein